jgi:trehalose 6-phosphate phosphatase
MFPDVLTDSTSLFLDVDGSLIDIAPRPHDVVVPASLIGHLATVSRLLGGAVALVSGRTIAQLDVLFAPWRFRASGVHGAEWRRQPGGEVEAIPGGRLPRGVWRELEAVLAAFPGTFAEDKAYSFAVHYRAVPGVAHGLQEALTRIVERHADAHLRLLPGHFVFEIKGADFDKGLAVRRFLAEEPFKGRRPIFVGDDVTDRPGFAAAVRAGGHGFSVGTDIAGTSGTFSSPSAVRQWLAALATREHVNA